MTNSNVNASDAANHPLLSSNQMLVQGKILSLSEPVVMGIINATPDSFFADSRVLNATDIARKAEQMLSDGAGILDIGAFSTRPGCSHVSEEEEWQRLSLALRAVSDVSGNIIVSVDTFRAEIARRAVEIFGAGIINDVSAGQDPKMFDTVSSLHVPYVLCHIAGPVLNVKAPIIYDDVVADVLKFLAKKLQHLHLLGVPDVIIDPGFGFNKDAGQSLDLLANLDAFSALGCPVIVGLSRKRMLCDTLGISPDDALNATTAANVIALERGAKILRVHDVKEAVEAVKVYSAVHTFK